MKTISSLVGGFLFIIATIGGFMLQGGNPLEIMHANLIIAIILAPLGSSILAFGFRGVWDALFTFRFFFFTPSANIASAMPLVVFRFLTFSTYAIGSLLFLLGLTQSCCAGTLSSFGEGLAFSICALAYPIIIAEVFLRPIKYRLEYLAERK